MEFNLKFNGTARVLRRLKHSIMVGGTSRTISYYSTQERLTPPERERTTKSILITTATSTAERDRRLEKQLALQEGHYSRSSSHLRYSSSHRRNNRNNLIILPPNHHSSPSAEDHQVILEIEVNHPSSSIIHHHLSSESPLGYTSTHTLQ
jgi:hypothetical protein